MDPLSETRDERVRTLWYTLKTISNQPEEMTEEDLDLWMAVTKHSAIQSRLDQSHTD